MKTLLDWLTVKLLKRLRPGFLPEPIFFEMQRINHQLSVELLMYKGMGKHKKYCLVKRRVDDKFWPSKYHIPGTMVRGNETVKKAIERLFLDDFSSFKPVEAELFDVYTAETKRGTITHLLYKARYVKGNGEVGLFYSKDELPGNMINYHRKLIQNL